MKSSIVKGFCSVAAIIALVFTLYPDEIRTSQAGLELIGNAESCKSVPYRCPANVLTVGVGSTTGKIDPNKKYSDEDIATRWVSDIKEAESCVNRYANGAALPQGVFDAFTSITFNAGCTQMSKSTMFQYARAGDLIAACNQFPRWVYAGGKKLRGLVIRREAERTLCLSGL